MNIVFYRKISKLSSSVSGSVVVVSGNGEIENWYTENELNWDLPF